MTRQSPAARIQRSHVRPLEKDFDNVKLRVLSRERLAVLIARWFLLLVSLAGSAAAESLQLPTDPRVWINSDPVSAESMRGKSIVLYFFEEGCPKCSKRWPDIQSAAAAMADRPVMLIGVNSGTSPDKLMRYVRKNRIKVPVIMDVDRSFESAAGVDPISLRNIYQARIIDGDGQLVRGSGRDVPGTLATAAESAAWNVDPTGLPPAVMPLWRMIEFGNFAAAAKPLSRLQNDRRPEMKTAAERLSGYVDEQLQSAIATADAAHDAGQKWDAYKRYTQITDRFAGHDLPDSIATRIDDLEKDATVKNEAAAQKQSQLIDKMIRSGKATPKRITALRKKLAEKYPGTEAVQNK